MGVAIVCLQSNRTALNRIGQYHLPHIKLRPAIGGWLAAREPVWDGEGGGCDRVAGSWIPFLLAIARACGRNRRTVVAERDPHIGIALRLPLDEAVAGFGPG